MARIVMYSTRFCGYCVRARALLSAKGIAFDEIMVDTDPVRYREMQQKSGRRSVPQIFIDGEPIGGFTDLWALDKSGELDHRLSLVPPTLEGEK